MRHTADSYADAVETLRRISHEQGLDFSEGTPVPLTDGSTLLSAHAKTSRSMLGAAALVGAIAVEVVASGIDLRVESIEGTADVLVRALVMFVEPPARAGGGS